MAKKRKSEFENPLDYISIPEIDLDPEIKKGILSIFIAALGALCFLSLFDLAGVIGGYLLKFQSVLFGWGRIIFPIILLTFAYLIYNGGKNKVKAANYLGLFLFIISFQSLLHLAVAVSMDISAEKIRSGGALLSQWKKTVDFGLGGGYIGLFLSSAFIKLLGLWASILISLALILASLMLIFNTTLSNLIGRNSWFAKAIKLINFVIYKIFHKFKEDQEEFNEEAGSDEFEEVGEEEDEDFGFSKKKVTARAGVKKEETEEEALEAVVPVLAKEEKAMPKKEVEKTIKPSHVKIDLPLSLLMEKTGKPTSGDIKGNMEKIKHALENFGIPVEMGEVSVGPTVTQYTFKPAEGVKLSRITTLNNDLALALAAHPIRIEAPIPGKSLVGIEVPNQAKAMVGLKEILTDKRFTERKTNLMMALGKDVGGQGWSDDLSRMPHLLVAGATNSGKSVCLNAIIVSLLYQNDPDDLKFIMVDPKRVELTVYNGIPHLLTPVITEVPKTINALKWCLNEMDRRFDILAKVGKRNIQGYNQSLKKGEDRMPYLVFIIDELADLMVAAAREVEPSIIRLAQMARAVGIHLILATQRPSVDVITGVIKANMPARIAFSVASGIDSRTILDSLGAEKLLGRGDMLFSTADMPKPKRIQGAFINDDEIKNIVNYIKERSPEVTYVDGITDRQRVSGIGGVGLGNGVDEDSDELLLEAKEMVISSGKASASYLQRRLSVGYARAARLLDLLEEAGVIGPSNGSKPRDILITKEQYENAQSMGMAGASLHSREESVAPESYLGEVPGSSIVFRNDEDEDGEEEIDSKDYIEANGDFEEEVMEDEELTEEVDEEIEEDMPIHKEIKEDEAASKNKDKQLVGEDDDFENGRFFSR